MLTPLYSLRRRENNIKTDVREMDFDGNGSGSCRV
jgi:hypothetical protein